MKVHRLFPILLILFLSGISACGGFLSGHLDKLDQLLAISDSVTVELNGIDPVTVKEWHAISVAGKKTFLQGVEGDTLNLEQAKKLDSFLWANRQLADMSEEREKCQQANAAIKKRLLKLKKDIDNGSGDRTNYDRYVKQETAEMNKIRNHSRELRLRYDESKAAIEQFQP